MAEWPELGERIKQRIRELGYQNAGQFADAKGYRITYIYKWIAGTMPKRATLHRLAEDLDVTHFRYTDYASKTARVAPVRR